MPKIKREIMYFDGQNAEYSSSFQSLISRLHILTL